MSGEPTKLLGSGTFNFLLNAPYKNHILNQQLIFTILHASLLTFSKHDVSNVSISYSGGNTEFSLPIFIALA
jgi:hypothetical protein